MEGARQFEGTNGRGASGSSSVTHTRRGVMYAPNARSDKNAPGKFLPVRPTAVRGLPRR